MKTFDQALAKVKKNGFVPTLRDEELVRMGWDMAMAELGAQESPPVPQIEPPLNDIEGQAVQVATQGADAATGLDVGSEISDSQRLDMLQSMIESGRIISKADPSGGFFLYFDVDEKDSEVVHNAPSIRDAIDVYILKEKINAKRTDPLVVGDPAEQRAA